MNIELLEELKECIQTCLKRVYQIEIPKEEFQLQETRKEFNGDITWVIFPITRYSKKTPEQTAQELGDALLSFPIIRSFEVVKGFLNITLSEASILENYLLAIKNGQAKFADQSFGEMPSNGKKVMVEFSSPNTNKPLHLGHVRNNLLGYAVSEILRSAGYEVIRTCLVNDRGIHICKSMVAYQIWGNDETPESSGLKPDHFVGKFYVLFETELKKEIELPILKGIDEEKARSKAPLMRRARKMLVDWENKEEEVLTLWKRMNAWVYGGFQTTYVRLGISFDRYYYESETYLLGKDLIQEGLDKKVFFKKPDGSVWIDLTDEGLDQKIVLRSDGTSVYITQDLGTAQLKFQDYHMDKSIHVVGNEQDYHFKVLFLILKKLGKSWAQGLYHLSYGMVDLPSGKMKSREGTVVDADDLMDQMEQTAQEQTEILGKTSDFSELEKKELYRKIGFGALKYFWLRVDPQKRFLFDPKESIDFQGNTGPFIQYTYARIRSILRRATLEGENRLDLEGMISLDLESFRNYPLNQEEKSLIMHLFQYELILIQAAEHYDPSIIAAYVFELAKLYNHFYHLHSVIKADELKMIEFRLVLSWFTSELLKKGMSLLGIEMPEKM